MPKTTPITSSVIAIAIADTSIALLAGLVIFPIVFANHLTPSAGPSLIFQTLPIAFGQLPLSTIIATLFFLMLFFAAFSSVIALLEPAISWLMETWQLKRTKAVIVAGVVCWILSLGTILSFSQGKHFHLLGYTFYHAIDFLTAAIMLPVGGFFIAIFAGWFFAKHLLQKRLQWDTDHFRYRSWRWILRYFAPIAILAILIKSFGVI